MFPSTGIHIWQMIALLVTQTVILYLSELYFVLDHQSFVSIVSFTLSLPFESHLVSLKVANFHKPHSEEEKLNLNAWRAGGTNWGKTGVLCTHPKLPLPSKIIPFYNDLLNIPFLPYHLAYIFILISALIFKQYC